jgi:hypothetical protein
VPDRNAGKAQSQNGGGRNEDAGRALESVKHVPYTATMPGRVRMVEAQRLSLHNELAI